LQDTDPSRANVPVWFTELGFQSSGSASDDAQQARNILKTFTMGVAQGVDVLNWYEAKDGQGGFGLLKGDNTQRPAYDAISNLILYLGQKPNYFGWVQINTNMDYGFVFEGASTPAMVIWAVAGQSDSIKFTEDVTVVDPVTGRISALRNGNSLTLSTNPLLILDVPTSVVTLAKSNKNRPFPWGGDFSKASSISVTMGNPNNDSGLHQFYPDRSSKPVLIGGTPARDCSIADSQTFTIDPNFMSYNPVQITITTVTRRNEANVTAGFNLKYEGPNGWKTTGVWYSVPGNDKWYTNTVTINDAQFINIWGFSFQLSSDSTTNSKYSLQSVTVSKV